MSFNYTKLHIFDKNGHEIPMKFTSGLTVSINNKYNDNALFYGITDASLNIVDFLKIRGGGRFADSDFNDIELGRYHINGELCTGCGVCVENCPISAIIPNGEKYKITEDCISCSSCISYCNYNAITENWAERHHTGKITTTEREISGDVVVGTSSYRTNLGNLIYINDIQNPETYKEEWEITDSELKYPSITFDSNLCFDKVSTELVETQSLYVLAEKTTDGLTDFVTLEELAKTDQSCADWISRYKLIFFIDCREQKDFRTFRSSMEDVVWSDRFIMDLTKSDDTGFKVNIGFCGENEGVYEQSMYVCLIDTINQTEDDPGEVYPIGEIHMSAETIGEDERYRTLFTNFGIPDPKEYNDIFVDSDNLDDKTDNISLNEHSKKVFLTYSEIFPYIGSYKALMNAVKLLGYENIFFKEWYKKINDTFVNNSGYVAYDMSFESDVNSNTISNTTLEERIQLRKLNWISMMYNLNKELDVAADRFGFPTTERTDLFYNDDIIVKLISLKKWLEKYILGVNCRIIDIGGEGVYFERYSNLSYGSYQKVIDYINNKAVKPVIEKDAVTLKDSSANIPVTVSTADYSTSIEDLCDLTFIDFCDGYLDENGIYNYSSKDLKDSSSYLYIGKTFEFGDTINTFELRAQGVCDGFKFNHDFIDASTVSIIVDENEIYFNPIELLTKDRNSAFTNLPIIQIEKGSIRSFNSDYSKSERYVEINPTASVNKSYSINVDGSMLYSQDYVTLIPPRFSKGTDKYSYTTSISWETYDGSYYSDSSFVVDTEFDASYGNTKSKDSEIFHYKRDIRNYGLRFSTDNKFGAPMFYLRGYEADTTNFLSNV